MEKSTETKHTSRRSTAGYISATIAVSLGEEIDTIEDVYEPYLIQIGFIARTPRGRMVLPPAYDHLGYEYQTKFM